jgi:hypothetical protein
MSIEINEEKNFSLIGILSQIFYIISILVFLIASVVFVYYQFIKIPKNVNELSELSQFLTTKKTEEEIKVETEGLAIQNMVDDYKILYDQRAKLTNFFGYFEKWIHPQVYFSNFSIDAATRTVTLQGISSDFKPLIDQLEIIKKQTMIERYQVSDIKLAQRGGVSFSLTLTVKPETLK